MLCFMLCDVLKSNVSYSTKRVTFMKTYDQVYFHSLLEIIVLRERLSDLVPCTFKHTLRLPAFSFSLVFLFHLIGFSS